MKVRQRLALIVACLPASSVLAQGTVNFANAGVGLNAPVILSDGVTKATGPAWRALLAAGPSANNLAFVSLPATLLTGVAAGYFNGGVVTIPTVLPGGTAYCQAFAWDSTLGGTTTDASELAAFYYCLVTGADVWRGSLPFTVATGGYGIPPFPPSTLVGLAWTVPLPEPSLGALTGVAGVVWFSFRARRRHTFLV